MSLLRSPQITSLGSTQGVCISLGEEYMNDQIDTTQELGEVIETCVHTRILYWDWTAFQTGVGNV